VRAVADMGLASENSPQRFYSMSALILRNVMRTVNPWRDAEGDTGHVAPDGMVSRLPWTGNWRRKNRSSCGARQSTFLGFCRESRYQGTATPPSWILCSTALRA